VPTIELTEGRDFHESSHPLVCLAIPASYYISWLVTDTLNYNWDCTSTNVFPIMVEDLDVDKIRTIIQEAIGLYVEV
jgi:hypothetical protein